jgi:LysR substrate binding domain
LRLDSGEAIRDAAIAGLGIAFLPDFLVAEDLAVGRLRQVLSDVGADDVKIVAIYPNKRLLEPRVRRFIDLMVEELETDAPTSLAEIDTIKSELPRSLAEGISASGHQRRLPRTSAIGQ